MQWRVTHYSLLETVLMRSVRSLRCLLNVHIHTHTHTNIHLHVVFMLAICCSRQKIYKLTYDRGAKADKSMLAYRISDIAYRIPDIDQQADINND